MTVSVFSHLLRCILFLSFTAVYVTAADDYCANQHNDTGKCLQLLKTDPGLFDKCKDEVCYLFLKEPPFIILPPGDKGYSDSVADYKNQAPIPCKDFADHGLRGIAFELHERSPSADNLCMWAGHSTHCTFNNLVEFTRRKAGRGYKFAITGLLLETPERQCEHHAATSFLDNSMVIIGRTNTAGNSGVPGAWDQLTRPFHWITWLIIGLVILSFLAVCVAMTAKFHFFRGRSFVNSFFIFLGAEEAAWAHENYLIETDDSEHQKPNEVFALATKYALTMSLYRMAVAAFIVIFLL